MLMQPDLLDLAYKDEFYFQWHITDECNLRCKHCYHENYKDKGLPLGDLSSIANQLCNAAGKWGKKASFSITGGEPLLRGESFFSLLELLDSKDEVGYFDILTNGTLLDEQCLDRLNKLSKLRRLQLSLEGLEGTNDKIRGAGSYQKIVKSLSDISSKGLTSSVMMTIGKHNAHEVIPLADELSKYEVDAFVLDRFIPEGQSVEKDRWVLEADELREIYEECYEYFKKTLSPRMLLYRTLFCMINPDDEHIGAMCSVGNNALTILPNGDVLPCRRLPLKIGNLLETTVYDIWYNSPLLWEIRNPANLKGKCTNCEFIPICRGCRAFAYAMTGDYLEADPQCWKQENDN